MNIIHNCINTKINEFVLNYKCENGQLKTLTVNQNSNISKIIGLTFITNCINRQINGLINNSNYKI